ncbi:phosphatase 1, regulatory subunit [Olea europaea subsp. europaea]|uniref:Phosphatase 1, regulatory subunit n=1 Tax=Olea europaea subsp. europaea TaxID=158383 RepID=A0A8S0T0E0_OLEEU|nr:phosphatase 1, regulatory subunit [Olea europaea subsp. europaea]
MTPSLFATSSFDQDVKMWDLRQKPNQPCYTASSSRGNVMVCFSPDDYYLLVSAIDNEVKQLLAVDGRLHQDLAISLTGSSHNYTRSYYMNGRDYVISGSCNEHVVRISCARIGRWVKLLQAQSQFSMAGATVVAMAAHRDASDVQLGLT